LKSGIKTSSVVTMYYTPTFAVSYADHYSQCNRHPGFRWWNEHARRVISTVQRADFVTVDCQAHST